MYFKNRKEAGQKLSKAVGDLPEGPIVVYGLARGGVIVACELAYSLNAELDVLMVKKIPHPDNDEFAIGAVAENSLPIISPVERSYLDKDWLDLTVKKALETNATRSINYRKLKPMISPAGKVAIIVDDGMATGFSMRAAVEYIKSLSPKYLVAAIPVAPPEALDELRKQVDKLVVLENMDFMSGSVGAYYEDFPQVEDIEVETILGQR